MLLAIVDYWAIRVIATSLHQAATHSKRILRILLQICVLLQNTFGRAGEQAGAGSGDPGAPATRDMTDRPRGEMMPLTFISDEVIISSTRSGEEKLLLKYFSRMTAPIQENCTAPLLTTVTLRMLKPSLHKGIK